MTPTRRVLRAKMAEMAARLGPQSRVLEIGIAGDDPPGANREFIRLAEGGTYQTADKDAALKPDIVLDLEHDRQHPSIVTDLTIAPWDVVICSQVLEHVWELETAARTLWHLTALGGHCLVDLPFCFPPHTDPSHPGGPEEPDYWRLTPHALERLLRRAGFGQVELWVDPAWLVVGALAQKALSTALIAAAAANA